MQDKIQHDLETSELRYRRLFETAQDGILLIDFNSGMILDVNPFLIKILGYTKGAFLKKHLWEVGVFQDIAASKENFSILRKKRYVRFEDLPLEIKSGKKINVEFVANVYMVGAEKIIQCNIRDITDRKKAEILLQQNEDLLNESQKLAGLGSYSLDIPSGQWTSSGGLNKVFGIDSSYDLSVNGWANLVHPEDRKMMVDYFQNTVVGQGKPFNKTYRIVRKNDHAIRWVHGLGKLTFNNQNKPVTMVGTIQDITRQYEIENELKKTNLQIQTIYDQTTDILYNLSVDEGNKYRFISVNHSFYVATGLKQHEVIGKLVTQVIPEPSLSVVLTNYKEAIRKRKIVTWEEVTDYPKEKKYGAVSVTPFFDSNGKCINLVGTVHDITELKKIEKALETSEKKFKDFFQYGADIELVLGNTGDVLEVNNAAIKIYGYNRDEFLKLNVSDLDTSDIPTNFKETYKTILNKGYFIFERIHRKKNGSKMPVEVSCSPLEFDGQTALLAIVRDITERKKSEERLRLSEDKFSRIFDTSPNAITITRAEDGRFIDVNKTFTALSGISRKEALESTTIDLGVWVNKKDREDMMRELKAKGFLDGHEFSFRTRSRGKVIGLYSARIIDIDGKTHILSNIADITELKRAENEITELKDRNQAILTSIGDAVFACDKDGKVLLFNASAEKLTGIPARQIIGCRYDKVITFLKEDNEEPIGDFVSEVLERNEIIKNLNHTLLVSKSGNKIPIVSSIAPIKKDTGDIVGCVVSFRDVTAEREIDKAKTEFVSIASHQLRTPLTAIGWYCEMLLSEDDGKLNSKQRIYARQAYNANKRMVTLMNALLNVSRLEMKTFMVDPKSVVIKDIAHVVIGELKSQIAKKKIILSEKYDPDIHQISADPNLLSMIIQNLLSNSVKYTKVGGKISLSTHKNKDNIIISISDTGVGIPKGQQDKVFTKLFRADNIKQIDPDGTGLGLYIVKSILDSTGGKIWFESKEGKGTTFTVSLPLSGMVRRTGTRQLI